MPDRRDRARCIGLREVRHDDTFIVSFPKSGNTWVRFLLASMLRPDEEISFRNIERYVPDIHKSRDAIERMSTPRFIKSHDPWFDLFPRFVYVFRDGRDAMISYHRYAVDRGWFEGSLREFVGSDAARRFGSWNRHTLDALEYAALHPARVLPIRYEDMLATPADEARRIAVFCNLPVDDDFISRAVDRCRFSRLQEIERRHGGEIDGEATAPFFRLGVHGQWRHLPDRSELEPFLAEAREALARLGYLA